MKTTFLEKTLEITGLGAQGDGLAREGQTPCFVSGALAGERVRAELERGPDKTLRGRALEILRPSKDRVSPPCPHFLTCGGCKLQHFELSALTQWKEERLHALFARENLPLPAFEPSVVTAPATRRRARFAAHHTKNGVVLGFNAARSAKIVDLTSCSVLTPALQSLLPRLRESLATWLPKNGACDLQATALDGGIDLLLIGGPALDLASREALAALADELNLARLSWRKDDRSPIEPIAARAPLTLSFGGTNVAFPAGSFLQATKTGEEALIAFARKAMQGAPKIADLFCGLGGFGLSLLTAKTCLFADLDGPAITALEKALRGDAHRKAVKRNLAREPLTRFELASYDAVLFDPPRGGAKAQAAELAQSKVPTIVAISCDPQALTRDAKLLLEGGYQLKAFQMVDQFLWSPHTECAALFEK